MTFVPCWAVLLLPAVLGNDLPQRVDSELILRTAVAVDHDAAQNGEDLSTISARSAEHALPAHPRIRVNGAQLEAIATTAAQDAGAKAVLAQLTAYGDSLLTKNLVNCTRSGVENSLLSQARDTLDRAYSLGLLYRLTKARKYADRLKVDLLNVAINCTRWNPSHFLDVDARRWSRLRLDF